MAAYALTDAVVIYVGAPVALVVVSGWWYWLRTRRRR
jgi:hypothetical protein